MKCKLCREWGEWITDSLH